MSISDTSSEHDLFLPKEGLLRHKAAALWPWKVATALLATLSLILGCVAVIQRRSSDTVLHDGQCMSTTDLPAAREAIELQQVTFTGGPAWDIHRIAYVPHPGPVQYFGPPSEQLDKNWEELIGSYTFLFSETEAKEIWPDNYQDRWDRQIEGYPGGVEVFHTLHCLNMIRKLFDPEYYPVLERHLTWQNKHRDHCMDQLRQSIMCAGDMTPYGTRYYEGLKGNYADTDTTHTCRNFSKLREFVTRRHKLAVEQGLREVVIPVGPGNHSMF